MYTFLTECYSSACNILSIFANTGEIFANDKSPFQRYNVLSEAIYNFIFKENSEMFVHFIDICESGS